MTNTSQPPYSDNIEAADWIRDRLSPPGRSVVSSIIPGGFEAYARILHPAQIPRDGRLVRWAEVSQWSGVPMHDLVQWHEIALPQAVPSTGTPWHGQGPREGTPFVDDVEALIEDLGDFTSNCETCFFCVWAGHLGGGAMHYNSSGAPPQRLPTPPQPSRLVELPWREYALFEGPLSTATSLETKNSWPGLMANLWWPADRSWCVASEIDLQWTYIGGSAELIAQVLADVRIESLPAKVDDLSCLILVDWLSDLIDQAADEVMSKGSTSLLLALRTVEVTWRPPKLLRHGLLTSTTTGANGTASSQTPVRTRDQNYWQIVMHSFVRGAVLSLVG